MEFNDEEKNLLRLIFKVADTIIECQRTSNYDVDQSNTLYSIKEKLGIAYILEG